jgi:hypothetical protein
MSASHSIASWMAGRMKIRMRRARVIAVSALVAGTLWTASFAFAQTQSGPAGESDQPQPSGQEAIPIIPKASEALEMW